MYIYYIHIHILRTHRQRERERNVYIYIYMGRERREGEEEEKERKKGGERGEFGEARGTNVRGRESGSKCLKRRWLVGPTIFARAHTRTHVSVCVGVREYT